MCFFFFSSRRRHTRCSRDWSSDVCSSDLTPSAPPVSEVQEQNHKMVREAASVAVAAETSRLVGELRTQLQEEAKKIVEGMAAAHTDQWVRRAAEKLHEAQQASAMALREHWGRKIGLDLQQASEHLAARGA